MHSSLFLSLFHLRFFHHFRHHFFYRFFSFFFHVFIFSCFSFFRFFSFVYHFWFHFAFFLNIGCVVFSFIRKRYQDPMAPSWFFHSLISAFHFGSWMQAWPDYGRPEGSPKEVKMRSMARGRPEGSPREVKMRSFWSNF